MSENIIEFEFAEDVQDFIKNNIDIEYKDPNIKQEIMDADKSVTLKVVKTIESPTTFISVDIVDEKFMKEKF